MRYIGAPLDMRMRQSCGQRFALIRQIEPSRLILTRYFRAFWVKKRHARADRARRRRTSRQKEPFETTRANWS